MCKLKCFYCKCNLSLLYQDVRQNDQWTLDRIDNTLGHNYNNIVRQIALMHSKTCIGVYSAFQNNPVHRQVYISALTNFE